MYLVKVFLENESIKKKSSTVTFTKPLITFLLFYCLFALSGCNCDSIPQHLSEHEKGWTNKLAESKFIFQSVLGESYTITQTLSDLVIECGGDECITQCDIQYFNFYKADVPFFLVTLRNYFMEFELDSLAQQDLNGSTYLGSYGYDSDRVQSNQDWDISLKDSLGNSLLTFSKKSLPEPNHHFIKLKFLSATGIISYTDRDKKEWTLKP